MATAVAPQIAEFAQDVLTGLTDSRQKWLPPRYLYDDLGSALFEAITLLREYGLARADEFLLASNSAAIAKHAERPSLVVELGSGSGRKTRHILTALGRPLYRPIDVSPAALSACVNQLQDVAFVDPVEGEWMKSLQRIAADRGRDRMLVLFLGSSIGNCARAELPGFFASLRNCLCPGDYFLMGADLIKPRSVMLEAYDDPTGVTAAFNLNLLARVNRELAADFNLRRFVHRARWNDSDRAVEMHLVSTEDQTVRIRAIGEQIHFRKDESIWTESSHKFTLTELEDFACAAHFTTVANWIGREWPFTEVLWRPS